MSLQHTLKDLRDQSAETADLPAALRNRFEIYAGLLMRNAENPAAVREIATDMGDPETVRALIQGTSMDAAAAQG